MSDIVLLCTVGGAHQPILKAIESTMPRHVCFFCTDRDPETGKPGSIVQVTGKDAVIKAHHRDNKPTLPNIPTQAGLPDESFETRIVPADDLDGAYLAMRTAVAELVCRHPGAQFVADYTGGTKTMTAALTCVALESGRRRASARGRRPTRPDTRGERNRAGGGCQRGSPPPRTSDGALPGSLAPIRVSRSGRRAGPHPNRRRRRRPRTSCARPGAEPSACPLGRLRSRRRTCPARHVRRTGGAILSVDAARSSIADL